MIILDTHIWLWWVNRNVNLLGSISNNILEQSNKLAVCTISCLEVASLARHQRIIAFRAKQEYCKLLTAMPAPNHLKPEQKEKSGKKRDDWDIEYLPG